jgi:hypothetical protein
MEGLGWQVIQFPKHHKLYRRRKPTLVTHKRCIVVLWKAARQIPNFKQYATTCCLQSALSIFGTASDSKRVIEIKRGSRGATGGIETNPEPISQGYASAYCRSK